MCLKHESGSVFRIRIRKTIEIRIRNICRYLTIRVQVKRDSESSTSTGGEDKENKAASPAKRPKLSKEGNINQLSSQYFSDVDPDYGRPPGSAL